MDNLSVQLGLDDLVVVVVVVVVVEVVVVTVVVMDARMINRYIVFFLTIVLPSRKKVIEGNYFEAKALGRAAFQHFSISAL